MGRAGGNMIQMKDGRVDRDDGQRTVQENWQGTRCTRGPLSYAAEQDRWGPAAAPLPGSGHGLFHQALQAFRDVCPDDLGKLPVDVWGAPALEVMLAEALQVFQCAGGLTVQCCCRKY